MLIVGEADRIENQMVVNISLVNMGGKYKLVLATQYFFCQMHPNLMGFLGGELPMLKGGRVKNFSHFSLQVLA